MNSDDKTTRRNPKVIWEQPRRHPSQQRMDLPAASANPMPTVDKSNHSATGTLHPYHSTIVIDAHNFTPLCHKVPTGFHGIPHITPKLPLPLYDLHPHLIHPFEWPHSPTQMASRSNQPFFHNSPTRDRPSDGLGYNSVQTPTYTLLIV